MLDTIINDEIIKILYSIVYSYYRFYRKVFMPHTIHIYTYKLVKEKLIRDYWRDWFWTGLGPYSVKLGYQILYFKRKGLLREICVDNVCGLLTIIDESIKPDKFYFITL
ncbi:MAG: hypothetical protein QXX35_05065 [Desulfurococcaceae archaeon]